ncbi:hypothetical protein UMC2_24071 [[Clostridium] sordellii]|uniref:hypothetical protein n=1 Tax=Paraclostridium sordellii TaxID=1505 RepID=UPI0005424DC5|nr:hypothetical protein [Paeniclostridium sordellii]CEK35451.1 hypothetical protein UMC2_24071 [[Clostridium] sordellii] [Paeniclostridium sordellii]
MINLNKEEKDFIREKFSNSDELLYTDDVNILLLKLNEVIMSEGIELNENIEDYYLNDFGRKVQRMYDNIYNNN